MMAGAAARNGVRDDRSQDGDDDTNDNLREPTLHGPTMPRSNGRPNCCSGVEPAALSFPSHGLGAFARLRRGGIQARALVIPTAVMPAKAGTQTGLNKTTGAGRSVGTAHSGALHVPGSRPAPG